MQRSRTLTSRASSTPRWARRGGPFTNRLPGRIRRRPPWARGRWPARTSLFSIGSVASVLSILSLRSIGSVLSIGSAGSILSIGSAGSILSIGSAGGVLRIGGRRSALDREQLPTRPLAPMTTTPTDVAPTRAPSATGV